MLVLMIAEGLVLLGLAHIMVLVRTLLTKGACLLGILPSLTRTYTSNELVNDAYQMICLPFVGIIADSVFLVPMSIEEVICIG